MTIDSSSEFEPLMRQAMALAENGRGHVEPNPLVGCLILKNNRIIGEGLHEKFGGPHAEVNALNDCKESPAGATAIVTLEPCCHHGKTPPCAQALIEAGISKAIIGLQDPNPRVDGGGIRVLRESGIEVESGFIAKELALQNAGFIKFMKSGQPWVIAKYAMTLDGKMATTSGDSKWISNQACRDRVHLQRSRVDAIIVGSETVSQDDPALTARPANQNLAGPRQPLRIIIDSQATTSNDSQVVRTANEVPTMVVVNSDKADANRVDSIRGFGIDILDLRSNYVDRVELLLNELGNRGMTNVVVEGGGSLLGEFLQAGQIDEVNLYLAPKLIGSGRQPFRFPELEKIADGHSLEIVQTDNLDGNLAIRAIANHSIFESN